MLILFCLQLQHKRGHVRHIGQCFRNKKRDNRAIVTKKSFYPELDIRKTNGILYYYNIY
nr:MAG TPA: hypothetical protein [Caudoviricetes sp.]